MTFMCFDSLAGRRLVHYEAFDRRAHRCKSSAAQINMSGAVSTALRQAKAAEQNECLFVSSGALSAGS
jgi:hypothetical protein